jgi:hypothetical protein
MNLRPQFLREHVEIDAFITVRDACFGFREFCVKIDLRFSAFVHFDAHNNRVYVFAFYEHGFHSSVAEIADFVRAIAQVGYCPYICHFLTAFVFDLITVLYTVKTKIQRREAILSSKGFSRV